MLGQVEVVLFIALFAYLLGAMFYILLITLILYRWMFFGMQAEKMTPPYWINMGALAITTLAGAQLVLAADQWPLLQQLRPFLIGFTLFFWATGTWWIPLLVIIGVWRHGVDACRSATISQYWSLVFPIGMYTVATQFYAEATGLTFLGFIPVVCVWIALAAWLLHSGFGAKRLRFLEGCVPAIRPMKYGQPQAVSARRADSRRYFGRSLFGEGASCTSVSRPCSSISRCRCWIAAAYIQWGTAGLPTVLPIAPH